QTLLGVETPDPLEQALPSEHLVASGNAAPEAMGHVEERGIAIGDPAVERKELARDLFARAGGATALENLDGASHPDRPVAEQAAAKPPLHARPAAFDQERGQQIEHDMIVVAGIERDALLGSGRDHAAHDIERAVAVERGDLDRDHVVDRRKPAPEIFAEL